jgi:hypothetical protein
LNLQAVLVEVRARDENTRMIPKGLTNLGLRDVSNATVDVTLKQVYFGKNHLVIKPFQLCQEGIDSR